MRFEQSTYDVDEDAGLVRLVLLFNGVIPFSFSVQANATGGSATGKCVCPKNICNVCYNYSLGEDYGFSELFTVEANMTNFLFNVRIEDDNIFEGNEDFILTIEILSSNIMVDEPGQTTITIIDDDRKYTMFNKVVILVFSALYIVAEILKQNVIIYLSSTCSNRGILQ